MMRDEYDGPDTIHASADIPSPLPAVIETGQLFGDTREIHLSHRGEIYRLRITAQQKLILTK